MKSCSKAAFFLVAISFSLASVTPITLAAGRTIKWLAYKDAGQLQGFKPIFNEFQKATGTKVSVTTTSWDDYHAKTLVSIAGGNMNEFYAWGTELYAGLARAKAILPLDSYIKTSKFDMSKQLKGSLPTWQFKKQLWGIPYAFYPSVIFYNKNLFDIAGVKYPTTDWTDKSWNWENFVEVANKLTKRDAASGRITQCGISGMEWFYMWPVYYGGDFTGPNYDQSKLTDPKTIKGIQTMVDMRLKHKVWGDIGFESGKSAMVITLTSAARWYTKTPFKWDLAATPIGTQHAVPAYVDAFSVGYSKKSKYMWEFIKWMYADKERLRRWVEADSGGGAIPTDKSLFAKYLDRCKQLYPGVNFQVGIDALEYTTPMYLRFNKNWPKINQLIDPMMTRVQQGKISVPDAMNSLNNTVDKLLKAGK